MDRPAMGPAAAERGPDARLEAVVVGRVQGVGFRWFVYDRAVALGLSGWVGNRADGSVEVVAQGDWSTLAELEAALRRGPPGAGVHGVQVSWPAPSALPSGFRIRGTQHPGD